MHLMLHVYFVLMCSRRQNRRKFDVLGKKVRGESGNRLQARDHAIKIRQKTLLLDWKQKNKSNVFVDKRFGEYDKVSISLAT
jgi:hypothetical protein